VSGWTYGIERGAQLTLGAILALTAAAYLGRRYAPAWWALVTNAPTPLVPAGGISYTAPGGLTIQTASPSTGGTPCGQ